MDLHALSTEFGEFSCVVRSLSIATGKNQKDFCHITSSDIFHNNKFTRYIKSVPLFFPVPEFISPGENEKSIVLNLVSLSLTENKSLVFGLHSLLIYHPEDINMPLGDGQHHCGICKRSTSRRHVHIWRWNANREYHELSTVHFVLKADLRNFYRISKIINKKETIKYPPPILPSGVLSELYKNSIEFLRNGKKNYDKYDVPFKRGILLCGRAGSGKTLSCKWLKYLCKKNKILSKAITLSMYQKACQMGSVSSLFRFNSEKPGIIFFDDMDIMVQNRAKGGGDLQTFLTEMDGIYPTEGVVYIFTTNFVKELDEAFVRPGRIDLFLTFREPDKTLREKFVSEKFQKEVLEKIDISDLITRTEGYTFAEIEEIRKLFVFEILAGRETSIDKIFSTFNKHRKEFADRENFGFNKLSEEEPQSDDLSDEDLLDRIKKEFDFNF